MMAGAPCPIEVMRRCIGDMHLTRNHHRLRHDRDQPGQHPDRARRSDGAAGRDGRPRASACRGQDRRRRGPHRAARHAGRILHPRLFGDARLLGRCRDAPREAIDAAGWMHTGDLATMDAEGYCNIVGRIKDMVIRGGENVYPREIEEFLYRHPKIQDVQVFGVPDPRYGEELCAWVKLRAGETLTADEIRAFCRDQIAHYKVPRYIRFVDDFPDDGDRQDAEIHHARKDDRANWASTVKKTA